MIEISVYFYRSQGDGDMTMIMDAERRPTLINPLYVVAIKPTAVPTDYVDIMMSDGTVYRVMESDINLRRLVAMVSHLSYTKKRLYAPTDLRPTDSDAPEESADA